MNFVCRFILGTEVELEQLRTDLKLLYSWSIDWQMIFNTDKCKVVHFGYNNTAADYYGRPLSVSGRPCYILPMFFYLFFMAALLSGPG